MSNFDPDFTDDYADDRGAGFAQKPDLLAIAPWLAAQRDLALPLAQTAMALGRLDADLAAMAVPMREGALRRLALVQVEAILWAQGMALSQDQIGRDLMDARSDADLHAMRFARWAMRRLEGQGAQSDLRAFLGLNIRQVPGSDFAIRATGQDFDGQAADFLQLHHRAGGLHPLARAPYLRMGWRIAGLSPPELEGEGMIWTLRDMVLGCEALVFAPLGRQIRRQWLAGGTAHDRMQSHLAATTDALREARQLLGRLGAWQRQAREATAHIKGSNAAKVIAVLAARPLLSASMIETDTGLSRITAERLLNRLHELGQIREVTGSKRFRLWTAVL